MRARTTTAGSRSGSVAGAAPASRSTVRQLVVMMSATAIGLLAMLFAGSPAQAADTATVSVVHGIPNTPVNVFVNGKSTLADFKPGTVAGPLSLSPGSYTVTVFPAANTAGSGTPLLKATATLTGGQNVSLVAHLTAAGKPTITPFVNDTSAIAAGKARLVVRHTAAAPAVDVRANGAVAFKSLTNPNQASADLAAGSISADVVLAGTSTVAIGPATLNLAEGSETIVYAIGSASAKSLSLVVQTMTGLGSNPTGMPAGSGGLVSENSGIPAGIWAVSAVGVLVAAGGLVTATRRARP